MLIELWPVKEPVVFLKRAPTGQRLDVFWGLSHSAHLDLLSELDGVQLTRGRDLYNEEIPGWMWYLFMFRVFTWEFQWSWLQHASKCSVSALFILWTHTSQSSNALKWCNEKLYVKTRANTFKFFANTWIVIRVLPFYIQRRKAFSFSILS